MKIEVAANLPGYEKNGRIYGVQGMSPTVQARDFKDPIKVVVERDG